MTAHFVDLLDVLRRRSLRMAGLVEEVVKEACEAVFQADVDKAKRVVQRDNDVDAEEVEVESEVIRLLALYQPVGSDLRLLGCRRQSSSGRRAAIQRGSVEPD